MKAKTNKTESEKALTTLQELDESYLTQLLDAFNGAASRSRQLMLTLMFGAFLVFIAWFNSLSTPYNWLDSRIVFMRDIGKYILFPDQTNSPGYKTFESLKELYFECESGRVNKIDSLSEYAEISKSLIRDDWNQGVKFRIPFREWGQIDDLEKRILFYEKVLHCTRYINEKNILNEKVYIQQLNELIESETENVLMVRIPILGVSFDINNLCIFSGLFFTVVLIFLYFSLQREHRNLKYIFYTFGNDKINHSKLYILLSAHQVLTMPRKIYSLTNFGEVVNRHLANSIILLPLVMVGIIFSYDISTLYMGNRLSQELTSLSIIIASFIIFLLFYSSIKVFYKIKRIDNLWDNQAIKIFYMETVKTGKLNQKTKDGKTHHELLVETFNKHINLILGRKRYPGHHAYFYSYLKAIDTYYRNSMDNKFSSNDLVLKATAIFHRYWLKFKHFFRLVIHVLFNGNQYRSNIKAYTSCGDCPSLFDLFNEEIKNYGDNALNQRFRQKIQNNLNNVLDDFKKSSE